MRHILALLLVLVAAGPALSEVKTETIEYDHGDVKLVGYLAWDDSSAEKRPGVLVVHEWWGLNDYVRERTQQLAELGYAAFAVDMYGEGKVTEHAEEAGEWANQIRENIEQWRERATRGLEVLRRQEQADPQRLAAIGYCFGGATVMQLAYAGADLRGVVSFHGSLPAANGDQESIEPKILVCHGAADSFVPEERAQQFREALEQAGADWQMIYYGGARHSFTNPEADEQGIEGLKYDKQADRRSWAHMRLLFAEIF